MKPDFPDTGLTVVVATRNGVCWLPDLFASLARQTLMLARLSILDDASTDGTWDLVRDAAVPGGQTVAGRQETNEGAIGTFQRLLSMVDTEYFALCDQDDVWLSDKLENSARLLEMSGADLVYTDLRVVDEDLNELAPSMWRLSNIVPVTGHAVVPLLLKNSVTGCTVVARRQLLERALPFPDGIPMHDWWLALVAACGSGVQALHEQTVLYRQHGTNALGAAKFSSKGLSDLLERRHLTMGTYTLTRLSGRLALIRGLEERNLAHLPFLRRFYRLPTGLRLVLSPIYLGYTVTRAHVLGWRNLLVDAALTCLPLGSSHKGVTA
ncbi:glycosyltransferase family 2 protein [Candidatus Cryosericum septentrionale]|jgi:glycosyltransferase involved in cell wall biosynthesis|uniref:Glycosyltransferase family 2 protein n=1 Tax=Candidatus Cryosericum septentrionale TaxID=2290913 RepID=A0A398E078_9BACT|nr:glycosyltransferase family 2 protein [Candidatus Cryosericum septentrionale]RIE16031.1 glycosyltransferase family 2 protein [Candidatus Cryosericum septentrionale]